MGKRDKVDMLHVQSRVRARGSLPIRSLPVLTIRTLRVDNRESLDLNTGKLRVDRVPRRSRRDPSAGAEGSSCLPMAPGKRDKVDMLHVQSRVRARGSLPIRSLPVLTIRTLRVDNRESFDLNTGKLRVDRVPRRSRRDPSAGAEGSSCLPMAPGKRDKVDMLHVQSRVRARGSLPIRSLPVLTIRTLRVDNRESFDLNTGKLRGLCAPRRPGRDFAGEPSDASRLPMAPNAVHLLGDS